ncbi:endonuclease MutS2 [Bacteroidota bacterium]
MTYPDDFEKKIGFTKLRDKLKELCKGDPGRELVDNMLFASSIDFISEALNKTDEFKKICLSEENVPTGFFRDTKTIIAKTDIDGTYIEARELVELKLSLESVKSYINFFKKKPVEEYPCMKKLSSKVKIFPFVLDNINRIINKTGVVKDNASPELEGIRRKIREKQNGINKQISGILRKAQKDGWVEQDVTLSVRDGRVVIPVASAYKRKLHGIVHDESSTGKTSYIEPAEIVEVNNVVKELIYAEKREIIKILISFTSSIKPYKDELNYGGEYLAEIDFIRAKALLAISLNAILPKYTETVGIDWIDARHPILFMSYASEERKIVPLNIKLEKNNRILLISGPNAGGKSVCLKTVGLIQYMFQCGMLIPVNENSSIGIFKKIFIDIGDEQSIENDLSTYSSHLINMKYFIKNADMESLLLIDEFGTGTEPLLGGSLAESILSELNKKKTYGVITTHYSNLKHFASNSDGIINGAMLFDSNKMQPLFQLSIGKPGSSFAFEIAGKIGLSPELLSEAAERIGEEHINFDKHLREIERDKRYWGRKRQNIRKAEKRIQELIELYNKEIDTLHKQTKDILDEAHGEAKSVLSGTNKLIENTIRRIKESQAEKEKTKTARKELEVLGSKLIIKTSEEAGSLKKIKKLGANEEKIRKTHFLKKPPVDESIRLEDLIISEGDKVLIIGQEAYGEVLDVNDEIAIVSIGDMKMSLKKERLQKISNKEYKMKSKSPGSIKGQEFYDIGKKQMEFNPNIDVRGLRADEALQKVSDFIDESIMLNKSEVRILHGKGNGILRQLIREFLQGIDLITDYRDEHVQFGGAGITVVKF